MKRIAQIAMTLAFLLSSCATFQTEPEYLNLPFEPGWKIGNRIFVKGKYEILEFIREGDNIKGWKELYTVQNSTSAWGAPSPEETLNSLKANREKLCPGVTKWNVVSKDETSILYEWQAKPCLEWPEQHEIARIIYGKNSRFSLRYTVKVYEMPAETRDKWIRNLSSAEIENKPRP